ncbi:hypothetical protein TYRP_007154 [Tyrophagus putrescentiae]|nr:hypothetical protein TYRP_007154 [Tyrophagus putrescentiae]
MDRQCSQSCGYGHWAAMAATAVPTTACPSISTTAAMVITSSAHCTFEQCSIFTCECILLE